MKIFLISSIVVQPLFCGPFTVCLSTGKGTGLSKPRRASASGFSTATPRNTVLIIPGMVCGMEYKKCQYERSVFQVCAFPSAYKYIRVAVGEWPWARGRALLGTTVHNRGSTVAPSTRTPHHHALSCFPTHNIGVASYIARSVWVTPPLRVPLAQSGTDELLLYETTMDGMGQPDMYVAYHDAQTYPEYLITILPSEI
jgi:hypothetical protein